MQDHKRQKLEPKRRKRFMDSWIDSRSISGFGSCSNEALRTVLKRTCTEGSTFMIEGRKCWPMPETFLFHEFTQSLVIVNSSSVIAFRPTKQEIVDTVELPGHSLPCSLGALGRNLIIPSGPRFTVRDVIGGLKEVSSFAIEGAILRNTEVVTSFLNENIFLGKTFSRTLLYDLRQPNPIEKLVIEDAVPCWSFSRFSENRMILSKTNSLEFRDLRCLKKGTTQILKPQYGPKGRVIEFFELGPSVLALEMIALNSMDHVLETWSILPMKFNNQHFDLGRRIQILQPSSWQPSVACSRMGRDLQIISIQGNQSFRKEESYPILLRHGIDCELNFRVSEKGNFIGWDTNSQVNFKCLV